MIANQMKLVDSGQFVIETPGSEQMLATNDRVVAKSQEKLKASQETQAPTTDSKGIQEPVLEEIVADTIEEPVVETIETAAEVPQEEATKAEEDTAKKDQQAEETETVAASEKTADAQSAEDPEQKDSSDSPFTFFDAN